MPKPTTDDWRSGAHINFPLQSADRPGENLFGPDGTGWTEEVRYAVDGLMAHAGALTAITCPTVNSSRARPSFPATGVPCRSTPRARHWCPDR